MTDEQKDAEIARLRRSVLWSNRLIFFMVTAMVVQIYAGIDSVRTIRKASDAITTIADTRDTVIEENTNLRLRLRQQEEDMQDTISQHVWAKLSAFVAQIDDRDIAALRRWWRQGAIAPMPKVEVH